jgi:hypothetical protein
MVNVFVSKFTVIQPIENSSPHYFYCQKGVL